MSGELKTIRAGETEPRPWRVLRVLAHNLWRFSAWVTVVVLAAATTAGVMLLARLGCERLAAHTMGRVHAMGWLFVLVAAIAPWWGLCAVAVQRDRARAEVSDPRPGAR